MIEGAPKSINSPNLSPLNPTSQPINVVPALLAATGSTGTVPKEGRTIAVDPKVIPYGSIVYIQDYGYFIAEDCGGAIKGNRIDLFFDSHSEAESFGKQTKIVRIME